jgi:hypothetical protein
MKILHIIPALKFFRVYQGFGEISGVEQMIVGPAEISEPGFHYGYADFGIKHICTLTGSDEIIKKAFAGSKKARHMAKASAYVDSFQREQVQKYIDDFQPDVITQTRPSGKGVKGVIIPSNIKRVFINHGMVGHDMSIFKNPPNKGVYSEFDLCCGATKYYSNYLANDFLVDPDKIVLNALPQFDLLADPDYYNSKKDLIVPEPFRGKPIILYFGHIGMQKTIGIKEHRHEFFDTLFTLANTVDKIDGMLLVKPRAQYNHIEQMSKMEGLHRAYKLLWKNPRIKFINTQYPIYQYMFADMVVCNGYSTTEVESVLAGKPVIKVNLIANPLTKDYFKTLESNAAVEVVNKKDMLTTINTILSSDKAKSMFKDGRERYMSKHNILLDGKAYERVLGGILKL